MADFVSKRLRNVDKNDVLYFMDDQEFEEFAVAPHATIVREDGKPVTWKGEYSDAYKECIRQGKCFNIARGSLDDSLINKQGWVTRRVLIPENAKTDIKDVVVQLPVQNLVKVHALSNWGHITYMVSFDGQCLNPKWEHDGSLKPIHTDEAAALIVQKWEELYGKDREIQKLAWLIVPSNFEEQFQRLVDKVCTRKEFKDKLVLTAEVAVWDFPWVD